MTIKMQGKEYKRITLRQAKNKIRKVLKIDESKLNKLIEEKIEEIGGLITESGAVHIIANTNDIKLYEEKI